MISEAVKTYYVYILSNKYRTVFYTGVTNDILRRASEHASGAGRFTSRYRIRDLLYFETFGQITDAIAREKEIKGWRRAKKLDLIRTFNPEMKDLTPIR